MYSKLRFHVQASQGSALGWLGQRLFGALRLPERLAAVPWWARRFSVSLTVFTSDRFADHLNPPGHPERVERAEVMQVCEIFRGKVVDVTKRSIVVELTGTCDKVDAFEQLVRPFGLIEMARTGEIAIARGRNET